MPSVLSKPSRAVAKEKKRILKRRTRYEEYLKPQYKHLSVVCNDVSSNETMVYREKEITEEAVISWFDGFEILGPTKTHSLILKILKYKEFTQNVYREHKMVKLENGAKLIDYSIIVEREGENEFEVSIVKVEFDFHFTNNSFIKPSRTNLITKIEAICNNDN